MATTKAYTDLNQSEKLAEFLPIESADMYWDYDYSIYTGEYKYYPMVMDDRFDDVCIPCWSLAALLAVLPKGINISTPKPVNELGYCCWNQYDEIYASNPVDACVEMILKLHELNLL